MKKYLKKYCNRFNFWCIIKLDKIFYIRKGGIMMKKKIIIITLIALIPVAGLILWPRTQDISYLAAHDITINEEMIQFRITCAESAPKFVDYSVSYDRGIYTITVKSSIFYGRHWTTEGVPLQIKVKGEVKAIELKDNEKTKVIYPV